MESKKGVFLSFKFAQEESEIYFSLCYRLQPFSYQSENKFKVGWFNSYFDVILNLSGSLQMGGMKCTTQLSKTDAWTASPNPRYS